MQHLRENPSLLDEIEKVCFLPFHVNVNSLHQYVIFLNLFCNGVGLQRVRLLMLDGDVHRSTPLLSTSSSSVSHHEEEDDNSLDEFQ